MTKNKLTAVYLSKELREWLRQYAFDNVLSQGEVVRRALRLFRKLKPSS